MRAISGILAGLIAGFVATVLIGIVALSATFTPPAGMDASDSRQVLEAFAAMPPGARLALMLAWFSGGLAGAAVAKLIARAGWAAWTVAGLVACYVVLNTMVLPLPGWMQALSIAAPLIGGLLANHLVKDAAPAAATTVEEIGRASCRERV